MTSIKKVVPECLMFAQSVWKLCVYFLWIRTVLGATNVVLADPATDSCRIMQFKLAINNRRLEGHVIKSLQVNSVDGCEVNCFTDEDCVSVNIGPLGDGKYVCELSSSDHDIHPEDLKDQMDFIYRPVLNHCSSSPCPPTHRCQTGFTDKGYRCIAYNGSDKENWEKINDAPVCFGARDDTYGTFNIKENGLIYTFKLVHRNGYLYCGRDNQASYWGCDHSSYEDKTLMTVITFPNKTALLLADYLRDEPCQRYYSYQIAGIGVNSSELVFNNLSAPLQVPVGQEFQIWYGQDLADCSEYDNAGQTCVDVYAWYA